MSAPNTGTNASASVQFRCPICESQRFKPVTWATPATGSPTTLYECASCSFTFTDPLRFARKRAALRTKSPGEPGAQMLERRSGIPRDRRMVNLEDEEEIVYWCSEFGCSEWRLRDAVTYVGLQADDIKTAITRGTTIRRH